MHDPDSVHGDYCHWLIINIQGNNLNNGDTILPYKGPSPPPKTGVHRYIFELYKQNKNRIVILHLNSDIVDLNDSNFIGGFYNSQGRPIYCFGQETLILFEDINDCALVSFMSRKYESNELFRINLIDGTRILEGSTMINGEKYKIVTEYIPALN